MEIKICTKIVIEINIEIVINIVIGIKKESDIHLIIPNIIRKVEVGEVPRNIWVKARAGIIGEVGVEEVEVGVGAGVEIEII